jgi:hypothetical protein
MAFFNANPATGDRGARQKVQHSGKNAADVNSRLKLTCQEPRAVSFGARREAAS